MFEISAKTIWPYFLGQYQSQPRTRNIPPSQIPPSQSTYIIKPSESSAYVTVKPGVKEMVLQSDDYKKWTEMKNSFLFEPVGTTQSTQTNVLVAGMN